MRSPSPSETSPPGTADKVPDPRLLTAAVTRLRRVLRASIRSDDPWETLPMAQVELLQVLGEHSPVRIGDLAGRQGLAASTVSGLVGQMIASGLVARATDPADRRASAVTLTPAGRRQLDAWTRAHERRLETALSALDAADRAVIHTAVPALFRLAEHLGAHDGERLGGTELGPDLGETLGANLGTDLGAGLGDALGARFGGRLGDTENA
jgi:DNA-binding MarR family transcriptional regulator